MPYLSAETMEDCFQRVMQVLDCTVQQGFVLFSCSSLVEMVLCLLTGVYKRDQDSSQGSFAWRILRKTNESHPSSLDATTQSDKVWTQLCWDECIKYARAFGILRNSNEKLLSQILLFEFVSTAHSSLLQHFYLMWSAVSPIIKNVPTESSFIKDWLNLNRTGGPCHWMFTLWFILGQ